MDSNYSSIRSACIAPQFVEEELYVNTRQGYDALEISLKRTYHILGQARGWADVVGAVVLEDELRAMQQVIEDYQLQLLKGKSLRHGAKDQLKLGRLPNL